MLAKLTTIDLPLQLYCWGCGGQDELLQIAEWHLHRDCDDAREDKSDDKNSETRDQQIEGSKIVRHPRLGHVRRDECVVDQIADVGQPS